MTNTMSELARLLVDNIEDVQRQWYDIFAKNLEEKLTDDDYKIEAVVDAAQSALNKERDHDGHATFLMRDPLSDRLYIQYSTQSDLNPGEGQARIANVQDPEDNYDNKRMAYFYQLYDRLASETAKKSPKAKSERGYTGWVAVTGCPLRINSERMQPRLEDLMQIKGKVKEKVLEYGEPVWGHRISEHADNQEEGWSKRYLAVPIKSVEDEDITIGVLRYACPIESKELTHIDTPILESFSQIISAILHLDRIRTVASRDIELELEGKYLNDCWDYDRFMQFIAKSTRSAISSLYLPLTIDGELRLRLVAAHGISGAVSELRSKHQVKDYSKDTKGLTWEIYNSSDSSIVYKSVLKSDKWAGLNTAIFYKKRFEELGLPNADMLESVADQKQLLTTYSIKLIGLPLSKGDVKCGVLKAELPLFFDSSKHYDKADKEFLEKCVHTLAAHLSELQSFIDCEWCEGSEPSVEKFEKLLKPIIKNKIISVEENPSFWERVERYIDDHECELSKRSISFVNEMDQDTRSAIGEYFQKQTEWLPQVLTSKALDWLIRISTG